MKSPIIWLPTLLLCGAVCLVASSGSVAPTLGASTTRAQEVQQLRHDLKNLSDRLEQLESATHNVVPRGGVASYTSPSTSTPFGAA